MKQICSVCGAITTALTLRLYLWTHTFFFPLTGSRRAQHLQREFPFKSQSYLLKVTCLHKPVLLRERWFLWHFPRVYYIRRQTAGSGQKWQAATGLKRHDGDSCGRVVAVSKTAADVINVSEEENVDEHQRRPSTRAEGKWKARSTLWTKRKTEHSAEHVLGVGI